MFLSFSACRLVSLRAAIAACVLALGGCSVLQGEAEVRASRQASQSEAPSQANSAPAAHATGLSPPLASDSENRAESGTGAAGWNLRTLQSLPGPRAGEERLTFERAWRLLVEHDPEYHAALSGRAAAQTEISQGRAAILPQVQARYSRNKITGLERNFTVLGTREAELNFDSTTAYIQLQQPVFNLGRYAEFQRGQARALLGEAEFSVEEYEAAARLTTAFVDTLLAQGRLELTEALAASLEAQAEAQDALFAGSEGNRVDAQETRARLARAKAAVIAAEDELRVARRQLQGFIGQEPPPLAGIDNVDPSRLQVDEPLIQWLERAQAHDASIRAAAARVRVADTEVRRALARHLPTADLVMVYMDADSENLSSLSQKSNTFQVGLQVAIPIFSGGYDSANHARSRYERRRAEYELSQTREQVAAEVVRQYTAVQGGAERIAALISAVESGEQSLEAALQGYRYGINSNLDVLRRQDSVFEARFELLQARAAWLEARTTLATLAGEPVMAVFLSMDQVLGN